MISHENLRYSIEQLFIFEATMTKQAKEEVRSPLLLENYLLHRYISAPTSRQASYIYESGIFAFLSYICLASHLFTV